MTGQLSPDEISQLFAKLPPQDVAEFYAGYQQWLRKQRVAQLQTLIESVYQQIADNNLQMQQVHPSAIALASLARLQSNNVTDLDLLDRMLERGDTWLDKTIQHLEYCEKFDFIRGNYTEWCEHALEGAYDWIDSMHKVSIAANSLPQSADPPSPLSPATTSTNNVANETFDEATEEIFLHKLMSEEDISQLDTSLTLPTISPTSTAPADIPVPLEDQDTAQMQTTDPHAKQPLIDTLDVETRFIASQPLDTPIVADLSVEHRDPLDPTPVLIEETSIPVDETPEVILESTTDVTLILHRITPTLTSEEAIDSTSMLVDETSTTPVEHIPAAPSAEELLPGDIDDRSETSLSNPKEDSTTPAQAHPAEVSDVSTLPEIPTLAAPQSPEATTEPATATIPYYTTDDAPWRWEEPRTSENNTSSSQEPTLEKSTQQNSQPSSPVAYPPKKRKRNFLQRLFSRRQRL